MFQVDFDSGFKYTWIYAKFNTSFFDLGCYIVSYLPTRI